MNKFNDMVDTAIGKALHNGSGIDIIAVRKFVRRKMIEAFNAGQEHHHEST